MDYCSLLKGGHDKQSQCKFKLQFDSCCIAKVESAEVPFPVPIAPYSLSAPPQKKLSMFDSNDS